MNTVPENKVDKSLRARLRQIGQCHRGE